MKKSNLNSEKYVTKNYLDDSLGKLEKNFDKKYVTRVYFDHSLKELKNHSNKSLGEVMGEMRENFDEINEKIDVLI